MFPLLGSFEVGSATTVAGVVAFAAFFLIARVAHARQGIALAFGLTPLLAFYVVGFAAAALL